MASAASTSPHKTPMTNVFFRSQTRPPSCQGRYSSKAFEERRHAGSRISPTPEELPENSPAALGSRGNETIYLPIKLSLFKVKRLSRRFKPLLQPYSPNYSENKRGPHKDALLRAKAASRKFRQRWRNHGNAWQSPEGLIAAYNSAIVGGRDRESVVFTWPLFFS